jgi:hypothetical protein
MVKSIKKWGYVILVSVSVAVPALTVVAQIFWNANPVDWFSIVMDTYLFFWIVLGTFFWIARDWDKEEK